MSREGLIAIEDSLQLYVLLFFCPLAFTRSDYACTNTATLMDFFWDHLHSTEVIQIIHLWGGGGGGGGGGRLSLYSISIARIYMYTVFRLDQYVIHPAILLFPSII